jgi:hypothetical protein
MEALLCNLIEEEGRFVVECKGAAHDRYGMAEKQIATEMLIIGTEKILRRLTPKKIFGVRVLGFFFTFYSVEFPLYQNVKFEKFPPEENGKPGFNYLDDNDRLKIFTLILGIICEIEGRRPPQPAPRQ